MRVFIPLIKGNGDIHISKNPFVNTLTDYIIKEHKDVKFFYNVELFDTDEVFSFDIVHIMWASRFFYAGTISAYENRLKSLKQRGVKIVSTCHNNIHYYSNNEEKNAFYRITYQESDLIIHLGHYSKTLYENKYPFIKQIIIPHHVYDTVYTDTQKDETGVKRYIACIGAFRDAEEIDLVKSAGKALFFTRYFILAPSLLINAHWKRRNKLALIKPFFQLLWLRWRYHIITYDKNWVGHESLTKYMNRSCISFIPRVINLNSGNLTLGFLFGNVVVGPNIGNIGEILRSTGNPIYNPRDKESLKLAIHESIHLQETGKGSENKKYALEHWTTKAMAIKHYESYVSIL